jgi:hypothetical protein
MYMMSYFRTPAEALHLAVSDDGLEWRALNGNRPILSGTVNTKTLRDPFIMRAQDGQFHLFATDGWSSDSIIHARSADLIHWSPQVALPVMAEVPGVRNCWAPECFYDHEAELYRVIWSSTVRPGPGPALERVGPDSPQWDHRIWGTTTRDFQHYSPAELFFDPGYNVIDATVGYHEGSYLLAFKDERGENRIGTGWKAIRVCLSTHASGAWTEISELITPALTEGPTLFRYADCWRMVFDHFMEGYFGGMQSSDGVHWDSITNRMSFPPGVRHASILQVDREIGENLLRLEG